MSPVTNQQYHFYHSRVNREANAVCAPRLLPVKRLTSLPPR